jgi:PAS domain S-box-containing protein
MPPVRAARHYRTLVETSPNAIVAMDLKGQIFAANNRAALLTGYKAEEFINRRAMDFVFLGERCEALRTLREIRETGSVRNRRFTLLKKDGATLPVEVSAALILDAQKQPKSVMAIFRDISHRLQAEKALRDSEEKYRLLVNQIPAVVYKAYADCTIDFFDQKVEALTGYPKDYFDRRTLLWKELILPEDLPEARKKFIQALKTNKAYVREYRIRRKDGEIRWIHNRGQIFCDAAGRIDSVSGVLFDITDRKQAEEKLYRASRALRALGECNQALVHATEESAFLQDVCRIIVEVTGYRLSWVGIPQHDEEKAILPVAQVGRHGETANWIKNTWADDDMRGWGPGGRAIRTGKTQIIRNILEAPALAPWHQEAGRRGYNSIIVLPLTMEGETIAILDILSEEVNAFDSEEIQLLEELANNVSQGMAILRERAQRRQALAEKTKLEKQLRQAQKMEAIGTLAGGIAHDFNNILTAIVGYSELILMNLDQKQDFQIIENHLQGVLQAGNRAKDLVQQILTFSRKQEQENQPVQVSLIIEETVKLLRASLPTTIEIRASIDPQCGTVLADPTQIHQVVMNIGTNAYQAMREDGGLLEVSLAPVKVDAGLASTHPHLHAGSYLRLRVQDTGHGMEPEVLERIFEPYFTTKGLAEGTGLGLAVVHGIVSGLGGAILVDSQIGKGTTFQVYFPHLGSNGLGEVPEAVVAEPIATSVRGEHILFIDDEPVLAHIGEKILKCLGYRVTMKTSSLEALELFSAQPEHFDLVISDQTMPQLTGIQLAQKIIRLRPEMPIILCTGSSETVRARKAQKHAIREYLLKPFNVGDLAKTIQRVLHPEKNISLAGNLKLSC